MKTDQKPPRWNIFWGNNTSKSLVTGLCIAGGIALAASSYPSWAEAAAPAELKKPNILVIWGDDIGMWNVGAYTHGMMGRTPNIDSLAKGGAIFTDHYGQGSCTAGRAAFITGQMPLRTGETTIGIPGSKLGLQKEDPTLAEVLKSQGYTTSFCRPSTALTSGMAISITLMPRKSLSNSLTPARRTRST